MFQSFVHSMLLNNQLAKIHNNEVEKINFLWLNKNVTGNKTVKKAERTRFSACTIVHKAKAAAAKYLIGFEVCMQTESKQILHRCWHNIWFIEFIIIYLVNNKVRELDGFDSWCREMNSVIRPSFLAYSEWSLLSFVRFKGNGCCFICHGKHHMDYLSTLLDWLLVTVSALRRR